ncbi:SHOCT domain-containing protein [Kitasatospora sp. NPDC058965]|uniref:SHOCT domain-containing protein n=1 Tax=Kitasatospora sp. NPDC058965 TaxID=3346682 RepID=UPI003692BBBA
MYANVAQAGWHPWFLFIPFFWLAVVVLVFAVLRRTVWRRAGACGYGYGGRQAGPMAVLGERYARGEIDEDEYRARRAVITEGDR